MKNNYKGNLSIVKKQMDKSKKILKKIMEERLKNMKENKNNK